VQSKILPPQTATVSELCVDLFTHRQKCAIIYSGSRGRYTRTDASLKQTFAHLVQLGHSTHLHTYLPTYLLNRISLVVRWTVSIGQLISKERQWTLSWTSSIHLHAFKTSFYLPSLSPTWLHFIMSSNQITQTSLFHNWATSSPSLSPEIWSLLGVTCEYEEIQFSGNVPLFFVILALHLGPFDANTITDCIMKI